MPAQTSQPPRIPIVVGVSGHRDLDPAHVGTLESRVSEVLSDLAVRFEHSPIVVLTSLAEGADQLAARVALRDGHRIVALLPMPLTEYESDFASEELRAELRRLVDAADGIVTLPSGTGTREDLYAAAGAAIARLSALLVALWDGEPAAGVGGTADVVEYKLRGTPPRYESRAKRPLDPPEKGLVVQIVTPRAGTPTTQPPGTIIDRDAEPGERERTELRLTRIDEHNRDAPEPTVHPDADADPATAHARRAFERADALAIDLQRRSVRTLHALMAIAIAGSVCFGAYSSISPSNQWLLGGYLFFLLCSYWVWHRRIQRQEIETRYLDARALAEGLRVQHIWRTAGLDDDTADHYLRKQRSELDWIRTALRALDLPNGAGPPARFDLARAEAALRAWVSEQRGYFARAGRKTHRLNARFATGARVAYIFAVLVSVLHFVLMCSDKSADILLLPIALLLVGVVLSELYANKRVLAEHAKRYARMSDLFAMASSLLDDLDRAPEPERADLVHNLLLELGSEALAENAEWLLIHRERPTEFAM